MNILKKLTRFYLPDERIINPRKTNKKQLNGPSFISRIFFIIGCPSLVKRIHTIAGYVTNSSDEPELPLVLRRPRARPTPPFPWSQSSARPDYSRPGAVSAVTKLRPAQIL